MVTRVAAESQVRSNSIGALPQGTATCLAITVLTYARLNGADPLFQFAWTTRIGSRLLFGFVAAASLVSLSTVTAAGRTSRDRVTRVLSYSAASIATLAIGGSLLAHFCPHPGETLRFLAAPIMPPLLVFLAAANAVIWRRTVRANHCLCAKWPAEFLLALLASVTAIGIYVVTNTLGIKGFATQSLIILTGAVVPALALMTAFISLHWAGRAGSVAWLTAGAGSGAMIVVLSLL